MLKLPGDKRDRERESGTHTTDTFGVDAFARNRIASSVGKVMRWQHRVEGVGAEFPHNLRVLYGWEHWRTMAVCVFVSIRKRTVELPRRGAQRSNTRFRILRKLIDARKTSNR